MEYRGKRSCLEGSGTAVPQKKRSGKKHAYTMMRAGECAVTGSRCHRTSPIFP